MGSRRRLGTIPRRRGWGRQVSLSHDSISLLMRFRPNNNSFVSDASGTSLHHSDSITNDGGASSNMTFNRVDPNAPYKLPADPWVLHVRWRKDGMCSPRAIPRVHSLILNRPQTPLHGLPQQRWWHTAGSFFASEDCKFRTPRPCQKCRHASRHPALRDGARSVLGRLQVRGVRDGRRHVIGREGSHLAVPVLGLGFQADYPACGGRLK
jgi:hypothetical protein